MVRTTVSAIVKAARRALWICRCAWTTLTRRPQLHRARLLADLYAHNASRQMPQKGSSDQAVACLRRLGAGVVGSAAVFAFRFRPPGTGSKRAGWRRSGAIFAFFGAVCVAGDK